MSKKNKQCPTIQLADKIRFVGGALDGGESTGERVKRRQFFMVTDLESKPCYVADRRIGNVVEFVHAGSVAHYFVEGGK